MKYRVAEYSAYQKLGGKGDWKNGILVISLSSWNEFHEVTAKLLDLGDFVWRGQEQDLPLISKFDRLVKSQRETKLEEHKNAFVSAICGRRGNNPPTLDTPEKIWSLGRHYGLATPLLDWTESPFVAAYFAFEKNSVEIHKNSTITGKGIIAENKESVFKDIPTRFIYGLSEDIWRWGPVVSEGSEPCDYFIKFIRPDSDENPRLLSQRGLYTEPLSSDIEVEKIVGLCYAKDVSKGHSRIIFVKIQIPEFEREACLRNLNRMNINHATLFPEYCNLKLEIENY
jgi:hypothetical protein